MREPMKCPFRTDERLEFKNCYGKACMAYAVYEDYLNGEPVPVETCLRLNHQVSKNYIPK